MIRMSRIDKTSGLLTEDLLGNMAVQKCIRYIHLMHRPCARHRKLKDCSDRARFHTGAKVSVKSIPARWPKPCTTQ